MSMFDKHMKAPARKPRRKWYHRTRQNYNCRELKTELPLTILYVVGLIDRNGVSWDDKCSRDIERRKASIKKGGSE